MAVSKKPAPGKAVVARKSTAVGAVGSWRDRLAGSLTRMAETQAALPSSTGNYLSFDGGEIRHGEQLLDNPLPVVILAVSNTRSYYSGQYDPDSGATPDCYSYDLKKPHEKAPTPQSDTCKDCRFNQFNSAREGSGKGCKEGGSFAMIHASALDSPKLIEAAPMVTARLSVLNSKTLRSFIDSLKVKGQALWQDITQIHNKADKKSKYAVSFTRDDAEFDDETLDALSAREDAALELLLTPYPEAKEKAPARGKTAVRKSKFQK